MRDPYFYPGTEILKNCLGIMDDIGLRKAEADYVSLNLAELARDDEVKVFNFSSLCQMHYRIFRDIFEWAGKPRVINIEKAEVVLNGISIEYSDVFDIERDAGTILADMQLYKWRQVSFDEIVKNFSAYMAKLWKVHPFREGNTRTIVTFCAMFIEAQGIYINSELFKDNAQYMRDALVAASAVFPDLGDRRKPEYLYRIVGDALIEGREIKEDTICRIKAAGYRTEEEQVRRVIFWDRKERKIHNKEEIQGFLKEMEEPK
ncbi:MAG: Fic family protein [Clostridium sp.]|nr:Fic family protein [Clostridium sp.]